MNNILNILTPEQRDSARRVTLQIFTEAHARVIYNEDQLIKLLIGIEKSYNGDALRLHKTISIDRQCKNEVAAYIKVCFPEDYNTVVKPTLKRRVIDINTLH